MKNKKDNKQGIKKYLGLFIFLFILVGGSLLFLFKDDIFNSDSSNNENIDDKTSSDADIVVSKSIDFNVDSMGYLQIVTDIELKEAITSDQVMEIDIKAYDSSDNLLHTYIATTKYYDISGRSIIQMGYDDNNPGDLDKIDYLTTNVRVEDRIAKAIYDYNFIEESDPSVVYNTALYRIFLDLDDSYYTHSGLAVLEYKDGTKVMERISELDSIDYIGVAMDEDFSTKNGSKLDKVSVYKIGHLIEQ